MTPFNSYQGTHSKQRADEKQFIYIDATEAMPGKELEISYEWTKPKNSPEFDKGSERVGQHKWESWHRMPAGGKLTIKISYDDYPIKTIFAAFDE